MNRVIRFLSLPFTPTLFQRWTKGLSYIFWPGLVLWVLSLLWGVFLAPPDLVQGEAVRLLYLHVPSAWGGLSLYALLGLLSFSFLVAKLPLSLVLAQAVAEFGTTLTAVCILTGALWGKPTWGTYWVWDARLTSMAILFLLYLAYLILRNQEETPRGSPAASLIAVIGLLNLPLIKYSVTLWATLHQPPSLSFKSSSLPPEMLFPLLLCTFGLALLGLGVIGKRCQTLLTHNLREVDRR